MKASVMSGDAAIRSSGENILRVDKMNRNSSESNTGTNTGTFGNAIDSR